MSVEAKLACPRGQSAKVQTHWLEMAVIRCFDAMGLRFGVCREECPLNDCLGILR